ncbi:TRAP transporter large permease subunit [Ornithinimicrobium faecis]|uniref:TRAP transporter large permease subunit n=1 Tax=Ornithinimicrobium faecis TaxID=2934158 RepID=A0ABY4YS71_9MICO|nr:TRAP transporter large permease subunit [Ornithinimicrobium sp. HY1793]USQ79203.1 TRAP transporter large permease subunit [Ornithinimicrobium sp. HY1793]
MSIVVLVSVLLVLFVINVPIAWALGVSSLVVLLLFSNIPLEVVPQRMFTGTDSFTLIAIPFFLLAGELMEKAGISDRLIGLARAGVGHIRGGLGNVAVGSSMMFSAVSGSGIAATAAMGKINIPAMVKRGYEPAFAVSIQASAGAMGIIIPPSIVMILYSVISGDSVSDLFIGGVIPGALMALALMATGYVLSRRRGYPTEARVPVRQLPMRVLQAVPALLMPVIILAGILLGIVTATESAVLAVFYAVAIGVVNRKLTWRGVGDALHNTAQATAMIMLIVANASVFAWVITSEGLPQMMARQLAGLASNPILVFAVCGVILLIAGMFLDTSAALIILIPVMLPLVKLAGIDTVHFGVAAVVALAIGLATPPVGLNLFVAAGIADIDIIEASRLLLPFVLALIAVLALLVIFPQIILWLPAALG